MYNNIGSKIKVLAQIIAWIGIIGSVITGFVLIGQGSGSRYGGGLVGTGVGVLIGGSLFSWISSWFMYGFGEIIEKVTEIAASTAKESSPASPETKTEYEKKLETLISWKEGNLISEEEFEAKKRDLLKGE